MTTSNGLAPHAPLYVTTRPAATPTTRASTARSRTRRARTARPTRWARADDATDNTTSGHFTTGRHAERQWRTDDDLARQRTGGFNQGRFA